MGINIFVLRANSGQFTDVFRKQEYVGIEAFTNNPFEEEWDLRNKDFLKQEYKKAYPNIDNRGLGIRVGQIYRFVNELKVGDVVICPYRDGFLLIGKIMGELYYSKDNTSPFLWRKKVQWIKDRVDRGIYSIQVWNVLRGSQTIYMVNPQEEILKSLEE